MTTIHEAIKAARDRLGWSQTQLAEAVSEAEKLKKPLRYQTVQQWENGSSAPARKRMAVVARILGLSTSDLISSTSATNAGSTLIAAEPRPSYTTRLEPSLFSTLVDLGSFLLPVDASARSAVSSLLSHLCLHPEEAELTARRVVALLGIPGNTGAQKSINSRGQSPS